MVTRTELMGLGMSSQLASKLGTSPVTTSVSGAAVGSANQIGGNQFLTFITASNSGSGLKMPQVIGDESGCLPGDEFKIMNGLSANIQIYAANNAAGSAVTFYLNAVSVAGTTGFSIATGQMAILYPIGPSTWVGLKSSV